MSWTAQNLFTIVLRLNYACLFKQEKKDLIQIQNSLHWKTFNFFSSLLEEYQRMEYKDTIDVDDLIMQTSLYHDLVASNIISEYGLVFYSLKSQIQVIMSKEQLKKELTS